MEISLGASLKKGAQQRAKNGELHYDRGAELRRELNQAGSLIMKGGPKKDRKRRGAQLKRELS